ncbi:MAG: CBS domain-containing protein [Nitrospinae bacterium]|nr:CBS domain-containing protein [Nitrospinota bacterium]
MKTAKDIMSKNVITVKKDTPISELSDLLISYNINGLPVVDDDEKVIGIVTQGDLIEQNKNLHIPTVITLFDAVLFLDSEKKFEADIKKLTANKVRDIYSTDAITISVDAELGEIATIMAEKDVHTLPVLDDGKLVGVIGKLDLIRAMA